MRKSKSLFLTISLLLAFCGSTILTGCQKTSEPAPQVRKPKTATEAAVAAQQGKMNGSDTFQDAADAQQPQLSQIADIRDTTEKQFDYRVTKLDNGLQVITMEDWSTPIVAVQMWYHVGSKDERDDRRGFAHLFEHMMFRGTDRLGPTDHANLIQQVGGTFNGQTSFDRTLYLETVPAEQIELALWLEAERMAFLKVDQESFDTERKVVEEERRIDLNQPYGTLIEKLFEQIYDVHPYQWTPIGNIANLRAATLNDVKEFWERYYVPNNATLVIVGAVSHQEALKQAQQYLGWIPRYPDPPKVTVTEPEPTQAKTVTVQQRNAPLPGVGLIWRTVPLNHPDTIPLDLLAQILGSGNSSRLYRELVAEKQIAVIAEATHWSLQQDGLFGAGAALKPAGIDPNSALDMIAAQIEKFKTQQVSDEDLEKAKNNTLRNLVTSNLTIESKAMLLGTTAVVHGDLPYVNRYLADVDSVTAQDIMRVAKEYLRDDRVLKVKVPQNQLSASTTPDVDKPAQAPDPNAPSPEPGRGNLVRPADYPQAPPIKDIQVERLTPDYQQTTLDNGLKVMVVPNHEVPFVTMQLGLLNGAWTESKVGSAAMAARMLTKGTANYSESDLAAELDRYAISLNGSANIDTVSVSASSLAKYTEKAAQLLAEVVIRPAFSHVEFEKLRNQVLAGLKVSVEESEYQADREFRRRLWGDHPYSRTATGEIADVNSLDTVDSENWWYNNAAPDDSVLIIAGDIETDKAFALANKAFANWSVTGKQTHEKPASPQPLGATHIYLVNRPGSVQSQIRVGQHAITRHDPGYAVSRIVSSYFGWGFTSRLTKNVRVEKGLTYGIFGSYIANKFDGEFKVQTFTVTDSTAAAVQAVVDEIQRLRDEPPSSKELEDSRKYITGSFVVQRETPQQVAGELWLIESNFLPKDYLEQLLENIAEAQAQDCTKLTDRTLNPDNLVIVVVGEADQIKDELEKIAPVTVVEANGL